MHEAPKEISILRSTLYKRTPENGIEPKNKIRVGDVGNSVSAFMAQVQISIDPLRYTCKSNNGNKRLGEWMPQKTRAAIVRRNTRLGLAIPRVFFFLRPFFLFMTMRERESEKKRGSRFWLHVFKDLCKKETKVMSTKRM